MENRRSFIKKVGVGLGLLSVNNFPLEAIAANTTKRLTIIHTNDVHSRLDPFPIDGRTFPGSGGIAARKTMIDKIRASEENVILLDAGDIFQGTPYFNLFKGELEIKAMSLLGYDAATMGNHDFDIGLEGFDRQLPHATFPFITSNYDFSRTILKGKTKPYHIIQKGGIKIGIIGLGVQLYGLVPKEAFGKTKYLPPIEAAEKWGEFLKEKKNCHLVICLSHLGYEYSTDKVSDKVVAANTHYVDIIIGGHTHTFLDQPTLVKNLNNQDVIINQVGWGGVILGKLNFEFDKKMKAKLSNAHTVVLSKQTIGI